MPLLVAISPQLSSGLATYHFWHPCTVPGLVGAGAPPLVVVDARVVLEVVLEDVGVGSSPKTQYYCSYSQQGRVLLHQWKHCFGSRNRKMKTTE